MKIYHVGLTIDRGRARFQYRDSVDCLSCEIYKYYGRRETTKAAAIKRLKETRQEVLEQLRREYPTKNIKTVSID